MRLTVCLCRGKRVYRDILLHNRNKLWRTRGSVMQVDRLRVPESLLQRPDPTAVVRTAEDMFTTPRYADATAGEIELGLPRSEAIALEDARQQHLAKWSRHAGDPRYDTVQAAEPFPFFSGNRRFSKGLDQAALLTNTVIAHQGAPVSFGDGYHGLLNRFQALDASDERVDMEQTDEAAVHWTTWSRDFTNKVERAILHAHVWHTDETKLPRRFRPDLPIWKHKAEHGIHPTKATRLLLQNLFRLVEAELPKLQQLIGHQFIPTGSDGLPERWTSRDRLLEMFYYWGAGVHSQGRKIGFAESNDLVVCGRRPLQAFISNPAEVMEMAIDDRAVRPMQLASASLRPMSPFIDLTSKRHYLPYNTDGWTIPPGSRVFAHPHLITVNASLPNTWSDFLEPEAEPYRVEDRQVVGLMHVFASAVAYARSIGLNNGSTVLDRPVCLQAVCSDGVYFDLISFQLNSLSVPDTTLTTNSIPPNIAWIDGNHRLFEKQIPKRSMLRNTQFRDLDMSVLLRLVNFYIWGMGHQDRTFGTVDEPEHVLSQSDVLQGLSS